VKYADNKFIVDQECLFVWWVPELSEHGFVHEVGHQTLHFGLPSIPLQLNLCAGCRMDMKSEFNIPVYENNIANMELRVREPDCCLGCPRRWYSSKNNCCVLPHTGLKLRSLLADPCKYFI